MPAGHGVVDPQVSGRFAIQISAEELRAIRSHPGMAVSTDQLSMFEPDARRHGDVDGRGDEIKAGAPRYALGRNGGRGDTFRKGTTGVEYVGAITHRALACRKLKTSRLILAVSTTRCSPYAEVRVQRIGISRSGKAQSRCPPATAAAHQHIELAAAGKPAPGSVVVITCHALTNAPRLDALVTRRPMASARAEARRRMPPRIGHAANRSAGADADRTAWGRAGA
ncbi:hypothetical protein OH77DRAFT_1260175 [Trametes cingulata]|nr:hypothetical protein OH77DRAFT_1260175 [Trametes cingulata]